MKKKLVLALLLGGAIGFGGKYGYDYYLQHQEVEEQEYAILTVMAVQNPILDQMIGGCIQDGCLTRGEFEAIIKTIKAVENNSVPGKRAKPSPAESFWGESPPKEK